MLSFIRFLPKSARIPSALLCGMICLLIVAAPLLSAKCPAFAAGIYLLFAPVCHQGSARSFFIAGHVLAVCQRCTGIYLGLFIGTLIPMDTSSLIGSARRRRILVIGSTLPLLTDVALSYLGVWTNNAASRFVTGFLFGSMLALLLVTGISELLEPALWRARSFDASPAKGGPS